MCTVTYLPYGGKGFILTSSRDENPQRPTSISPVTETLGIHTVTFPKDEVTGGTWVAASDHYTLCLLNGAWEVHQKKDTYRHGRGQIIIDFFKYSDVESFVNNYPLSNIEPFTLVIIEPDKVRELRWDGESRKIQVFSRCVPRIWSSVTLYDASVRRQREEWFTNWICNHGFEYTVDDIRRFHLTAGRDDPHNGILMNRNNLICTVSLTSIWQTDAKPELLYRSLIPESAPMSK